MKLLNLMLIIFIYFCLAENNLCNVQNAIKNECGYGQIYLAADRSAYNDNLGKKIDNCQKSCLQKDEEYNKLKPKLKETLEKSFKYRTKFLW